MNSKALSVRTIASAFAVAVFAITTVAADADVEVTVNGSAVDISPAPIVQAGRVFVPLRGVFEQLGASVVYDNGTINATGNGRDISLQIGSTQATVNGQSQTIDVAPFIVGASTYVPLRFISEALGDSVSWDDANSIAAIDSGGGSADYYSPGTASYVDTAPPPIPQYDQPYVPEPNYLWQPGYWAWGAYGYYWVPGTWVAAPQPNYLWTPGYWQGTSSGFHFNPGYWALAVGFYGGVDYGAGYNGNGYDGGQWRNNQFRYNTYVTRVNTTNIANVYVDRNVYVNRAASRVGYNGGKYGLRTRPTAVQLAVAKQRHLGMTPAQQHHVETAEQDRRLVARVNHNKPPVLAVAKPLSETNRPTAHVPVKSAERVNPLANVAPVHVTVRRTTPAAPKGPVAQRVRPAQASSVRKAAAPAPAPVVHVAPADHAPVTHAAAPAAYHAPVAPAARVYRAPVIHEEAPAYRAAAPAALPARLHAPAVYAAPPRPVPAYHAAPVVRPAPVMHPAVHAAPAIRAAPTAPRAATPQHAPPPPAHAGPPHARR